MGISKITQNNGRRHHSEFTSLIKKCSGDEHECNVNYSSAISVLDETRTKNTNRLLIGNLNINSLSSKFKQLKILIQGKVDTLIITDTP